METFKRNIHCKKCLRYMSGLCQETRSLNITSVTCLTILTLLMISVIYYTNVINGHDETMAAIEQEFRGERFVDTIKREPLPDVSRPLTGVLARMDDPQVIDNLRRKYIIKPPTENKLNLSHPEVINPSIGQAAEIRKILRDQRDGFYIECGALDGEELSNTLVFERELNWSGLLIEADPSNFKLVQQKQRNVFLSPTCLSLKSYPMTASFYQAYNVGKISDKEAGFSHAGFVDVECFPLYSYLLALNRTRVDYFSLDVEGHEFEVLENIPFDKVDIRTLSVEFMHVPVGKEKLKSFMESKGYTVWGEVTHGGGLANDVIFYKKDFS